MNIFFLSANPYSAAKMLYSKHIVKMGLESYQLLRTVEHHLYCEEEQLEKRPGYYNHPCAVWARETEGNYLWLKFHGETIFKEFEKRFSKVNKCKEKFINVCSSIDDFYNSEDKPLKGFVPPALAMPSYIPETLKKIDVETVEDLLCKKALDITSMEFYVLCYRIYYMTHKGHIRYHKDSFYIDVFDKTNYFYNVYRDRKIHDAVQDIVIAKKETELQVKTKLEKKWTVKDLKK